MPHFWPCYNFRHVPQKSGISRRRSRGVGVPCRFSGSVCAHESYRAVRRGELHRVRHRHSCTKSTERRYLHRGILVGGAFRMGGIHGALRWGEKRAIHRGETHFPQCGYRPCHYPCRLACRGHAHEDGNERQFRALEQGVRGIHLVLRALLRLAPK